MIRKFNAALQQPAGATHLVGIAHAVSGKKLKMVCNCIREMHIGTTVNWRSKWMTIRHLIKLWVSTKIVSVWSTWKSESNWSVINFHKSVLIVPCDPHPFIHSFIHLVSLYNIVKCRKHIAGKIRDYFMVSFLEKRSFSQTHNYLIYFKNFINTRSYYN